ncbi:MAG: hypothetical protein RIQ89_440 [Bacteroidota bacterium]|jgi:putative hydrolase of the HAD superfamily
MRNITHIFFDLDNTIWDFDTNSSEALYELYDKHNLGQFGIISPEYFITLYKDRNAMMWEQYRMGKIDKDTLRNKRFEFTFWDMGLDPILAPKELAGDYLALATNKTALFPHAIETLEYLAQKYSLHIITNGFAESQYFKLNNSGIKQYFNQVIISDEVGYRKPDSKIFELALEAAQALPENSAMVGDGIEVDVLGAMRCGLEGVYFNPHEIPHKAKVDREVKSLKKLQSIY